jgi:hypothetical protein
MFRKVRELISQRTLDELCLGFPTPLKLCLIMNGQSISNFLSEITEKNSMKHFLNQPERLLNGYMKKMKFFSDVFTNLVPNRKVWGNT